MNQPPRPGRPSAPPAARLPRLALATLALALLAALCLQTAPAQDATGAIRGLALLSDQPGQLQVFWIPPETLPLDYRLDWSRSDQPYPDQATDQNRAFPPGSSTSMRLSDLEPGVEYKLRIRARYDGWLGPWSDDARVLVAGPNAPALAVQSTAAGGLQLDWTADPPASARPLSGFDLRYIESAHNDQPDPRWTLRNSVAAAGHRRYLLDGLEDGAAYDVQLRWRGADGPGDWSPSARGTTLDHGDHADRASELPIGVARAGRIGALGDQDVFRIDLGAAATLTLSLSADAPLQATLDDATGRRLAHGTSAPSDDDASLSLTSPVQAGPHFLTISHAALGLAAYSVSAQLLAVRTSRSDDGDRVFPALSEAITIELNSENWEWLASTPVDATTRSSKLFKFVLEEETDVWVYGTTSDDIRLDAELRTASLELIEHNTDASLWYSPVDFSIRRVLDAGTYYVWVNKKYHTPSGGFHVHLRSVTDPGSSAETATPLLLEKPSAGRISSSTDQDYFRFELSSRNYLAFMVETSPQGEAIDLGFSGTAVTRTPVSVPLEWVAEEMPGMAAFRMGWFEPGAIEIRVSAPAGSGGAGYAILMREFSGAFDGNPEFYEECEQLTQDLLDEDPTLELDPLFGCQWHLKNTGQFGPGAGFDINVEPAWAVTKGSGINIALLSEGLDSEHDDLRANIDTTRSYNENEGADWWWVLLQFGTLFAGVIAADDDDVGIRGVAPDATIVFHGGMHENIEDNLEADVNEAMTRNKEVIAVSANVWGTWRSGPTGSLDDLRPVSSEWEAAVEEGVTEGFGGKGVFYVFPGDDGDEYGINANLSEWSNFYAVTAACGIGYHDKPMPDANRGANLWTCAPVFGGAGQPRTPTTNYGHRHFPMSAGAGTSTAIVSGVAALIRAANPDLTWRDVKLILADSARWNDQSNTSWLNGAAKYRADGNYRFSHQYGFGAVDAGAAVAMARDWTNLPDLLSTEATSTDERQLIAEAPADCCFGPEVTSTVTIDSTVHFTEFVEVHIELDHPSFRDLQFELISPTGTESTILPAAHSMRINRRFYPHELRSSARFGSARHLGEDPAGVWTLRLKDRYRHKLVVGDNLVDSEGDLVSWRLKIYGHAELPERPATPVTTEGMRQLTVTWSPPANAEDVQIDRYQLRYIRSDAPDKAAEHWIVVDDAGEPDADGYVLTNLAPGGRYDVQVRAVSDDDVPGPWSATRQAQASLEPPSVPRSVILRAFHRGLEVTWEAPAEVGGSPITSYELRHIHSDAADKADEFWTTGSAWSGSGPLQVELHPLVANITLDVQLRARNAVGASDWTQVRIATPVFINTAPRFVQSAVTFEVQTGSGGGTPVGGPLIATDSEHPHSELSYSLNGSPDFDIDPSSGQIRVDDGAVIDAEVRSNYTLMVTVRDPLGAESQITVVVNVVERLSSGDAAGGASGAGGGGGGAPPVAAPSEADFDWNVTRDIEALAREHDEPTGMWSDGETLRLLHNAASGADRLFAYDLDSGERVEQMEFELDRRNRFAHGIWSDGETAWVSDSGQDRLFAYILASGERVEELEFDLAERNRDPRGIWSDGQTLVVLDAVKDALFGYDPASGELAFEHALDPLNRSPRGIWSDGLGIWISDDGANRVFAYRLEEDGLRRVEAEEFGFRVLLKAGAGEARGIWSDGDTLWLADAEDAEVYSFNLPDAIQAQLASLALSDLELDFSPQRLSYSLELPPDLDETTVDATATQTVAAVSIEPDDADADLDNGHQVALDGIEALTVTVTSQDGSRSREYRVAFERAACFGGAGGLGDERLSTLEFAGGSLEELEACALEHGLSALYHFDGDSWRGLFFNAPDFLSRPFREFFAGGVPPETSLTGRSS